MADQSSGEIVADKQAEAPAEDRKPQRRKWLLILGAVVLIGAILWGVWYFIAHAGRVSTDNAYVGADTAQVTPLVSAPVAEVRVANTQAVRRGDILVVMDPSDMRIELAQAEGALAQAEQRFGQAAGNADSARAQVAAKVADIGQARARAIEARANFARARIDLARREALIASGAVSGEELSSARATFAAMQAARMLADAAVASAEASRASAAGDFEASDALVRGTTRGTSPDVVAARARLDLAKLNLARTVIRAPIDGVVTNRQVQIGQRIAAGAPIMTIVPVDAAYVDANFKEDQLAKVRPGQPVELTSDYYGGDVVYDGRVVGFAGGTGAAFSLIPAQNATGNWIKVVQRLPVRVILDQRQLRAHPLRVGLSMDATIDTRDR